MSTDSGSTPSPDQLDGWKEIAAYLGKSVRAAQRWERDMGLPVHRLKTPGGQIVFARRGEIEAWKARVEVPRDDPGDDHIEGLDNGTGEPPRGDRRRRLPWLAPVLTACAVALIAVAVWVHQTGRRERPVRFQVVGQELEARDGNGALVWAHRFEGDAWPLELSFRPLLRTVQVTDFENDGNREILAFVQVGGQQGKTNGIDTLFCFAEDGRLKWTYAPDQTWTFAGKRFDGPWQVFDALVVGEPGRRSLWVSYGHQTWWPGFLERIAPDGTSSVRFVQSGLIYGLGYWRLDGRDYVLAAGVNNGYAMAAAAILQADGRPAASPQSSVSSFRCDDCPTGSPDRYYLFPPTELTRLSTTAPYNLGSTIGWTSGLPIIQVQEAVEDVSACSMYHLTPAFDVAAVDLTDGFWLRHRALEAAGRLTHAAEDCPERTEARVVREWSAGVWREVSVPVRLALVPGTPRDP